MILVLATALLVLVPTAAHAVDEPATDDVVEVIEVSEQEDVAGLSPEEVPVEELSDPPASEELPAVDETSEPPVVSDEPEALPAVPEEETTDKPLEEEGEVVDFVEPRSMGTDEVVWLDGDFEGCFQQYDMVICPDEQPSVPGGTSDVKPLSGDFEDCYLQYDMVICPQQLAAEEPAQVVKAANPAEFTPAPALSAPTAQPTTLAETGAAELGQALAAIAGAAIIGGLVLLSSKRRLRKQKAD